MPFPEVKWDESWKPILIVDGVPYRLRELRTPVQGEIGYAVGLQEREIATTGEYVDVVRLRFYEVRTGDLSSLARLPRLRHLMVEWSTKMADLEWVRGLPELQTLILEDVRPADDLTPLGDLKCLKALRIRSGMGTKMRVHTLAPLAALAELEEASLFLGGIEEGGLRPLAACPRLRRLELHSVYPVEEYAYLLGCRPDIECDRFVPWVPVDHEEIPKDRLVIGKGRGFLDSTKDAAKLRRYEEEFERLRAGFAAEAR